MHYFKKKENIFRYSKTSVPYNLLSITFVITQCTLTLKYWQCDKYCCLNICTLLNKSFYSRTAKKSSYSHDLLSSQFTKLPVTSFQIQLVGKFNQCNILWWHWTSSTVSTEIEHPGYVKRKMQSPKLELVFLSILHHEWFSLIM